jgi:hypothetical protein
MVRAVMWRLLFASWLAAALGVVAPALAGTPLDCHHQYAAKKATGETRGQSEKAFLRACRAGEINSAGEASAQGPPSSAANTASGATPQGPHF